MNQTQTCEGGCRCGRLRFRISGSPLLESLCHCRGCQQMSSSAFSVTISVASDGFEVFCGEPVIGGLHADDVQHCHCRWCKSWVFTRIEPDLGFVDVRAVMLDDPRSFMPYVEMQTAEKLPWVNLAVERSFERFPAMEDYPALIEDYAAWRATR